MFESFRRGTPVLRKEKAMRRFFCAIVCMALLCFLAPDVRANSILMNVGSPTITGSGPFTWSYDVTVTSNSFVSLGDFFVIVDFSGYVPLSEFAPAGWTASTAPVVGVPDLGNPGNFEIFGTSSAVSVPDNAGIPDLVFTYTGSGAFTGSAGPFGAKSVYDRKGSGNLMATDHSASDPLVRVVNSDVASVPVAPLPSTAGLGLLLLGGLGGVGGIRRLNSRRTLA